MEWIPVFTLVISTLMRVVLAASTATNPQDASAMTALARTWVNVPGSWSSSEDPCRDNWVGVICKRGRVTAMQLSGIGLVGSFTGDILSLTALRTLDLSSNDDMKGPLPLDIGKLTSLENLILVGCSFNGFIPESIGSLTNLRMLTLNSNKFEGTIPATIGNLSNLYWLDLSENNIEGELPVSGNGNAIGLDSLTKAQHFHLGSNRLSGTIPASLFNSAMTLIHVLFNDNNLQGPIPDTLGLLTKLEILQLHNNELNGSVPSNLSILASLSELSLANNQFIGPIPNLTAMTQLNIVDMSNNSFDPAEVPSWFTTLPALTTLSLENLKITGQLPSSLFSLSSIQTLRLMGNNLNGSLSISSDHGPQLFSVDLRNNNIASVTIVGYNGTILLSGNPYCARNEDKPGCITNQQQNPEPQYSTQVSCRTLPPPNCAPSEQLSPTCLCSFPYSGIFTFRAPSISDFSNKTVYQLMENNLMLMFNKYILPVDSVALNNPFIDSNNGFEISLQMFPSGKIYFDQSDILSIGFLFSTQNFTPPDGFGPYQFIGTTYPFQPAPLPPPNNLGLIIGASVGGAVALVSLVGLLIYVIRKGESKKQAENKSQQSIGSNIISTSSIPNYKGTKLYTFDEIKKCTNNCSESNDIGSGGYGKVYRGMLPHGQLVAVKRAQQDSTQGEYEFQTEIELLSRVHHKNLVSLVGFCFDQGEQILVYEYAPNGTLRDSLSGKSGVHLDWKRRLRIALGAAKGIAYLHELADPPIVHRDIKSSNILLDERLNAKVSDFGLSKLLGKGGGSVTTQVKGTMGYMDPEYYMTQQLNEKSDVYSFGVLLLELITAKKPLEKGRYIVREVKELIDRSKDFYGLQVLLDPTLGLGTLLGGFDKYVDLALGCVEESKDDRPSMGEVVSEIEKIMVMAGLNPALDSAASSMSLTSTSRSPCHPYNYDAYHDETGRDIPPTTREVPN